MVSDNDMTEFLFLNERRSLEICFGMIQIIKMKILLQLKSLQNLVCTQ